MNLSLIALFIRIDPRTWNFIPRITSNIQTGMISDYGFNFLMFRITLCFTSEEFNKLAQKPTGVSNKG